MSEKILIPFDLYPQEYNNANCVWSQLNISPNTHSPGGWLFRNGETADLNGSLAVPIPGFVNATPAGKLRIRWVTSSSDTSTTVTFTVKLESISPNSTVVNVSTFDVDTTVNDTNNGAGVENEAELALSGITLSSGRGVRLLLRRAGTTFDVLVTSVYLVCDEA